VAGFRISKLQELRLAIWWEMGGGGFNLKMFSQGAYNLDYLLILGSLGDARH
jgi:hypothetical protein